MTLRTQIATDAATVFLQTDDFAETITYHPFKYRSDTLRADRSIAAVVIRHQVSPLPGDDGTVAVPYEVHVANSTTLGINSDEIDKGKDALSFPPRDGKTAVRHTITDIIFQDHGMLVLECLGDASA